MFGQGEFEVPTRYLDGNARSAPGSKGLWSRRKYQRGDWGVNSIPARVKATGVERSPERARYRRSETVGSTLGKFTPVEARGQKVVYIA